MNRQHPSLPETSDTPVQRKSPLLKFSLTFFVLTVVLSVLPLLGTGRFFGKFGGVAEAQATKGADSFVHFGDLPIERWRNHLSIDSDLGWDISKIIDQGTNGLAGMLFALSSFIWGLIYSLTSWVTSLELVLAAGHRIDTFTAMIGNFLASTGLVWVAGAFGLAYVVLLAFKGATTSILKTAIGVIIPLSLLFFITSAAMEGEKKNALNETGSVNDLTKGPFLSPSWIIWEGNSLSNLPFEASKQLTERLPGAAGQRSVDSNYPVPFEDGLIRMSYDSSTLDPPNGGGGPGNRQYGGCVDYIAQIHSYHAYFDSIEMGSEGYAESKIRSNLSSLWERSVLVPWIDAQYGTSNDIGLRVFCFPLEERAGALMDIRWGTLRNAWPGLRDRENGPKGRVPGARVEQDGRPSGFWSNEDVYLVRDNNCESGEAMSFLKWWLDGNISVEERQGQNCEQGESPPGMYLPLDMSDRGRMSANLTALAWCKWDKRAASNDPNNAFVAATSDMFGEFANVRRKEGNSLNANASRAGAGLTPLQSCNQWWDFGVQTPRVQGNNEGIFKFSDGGEISDATRDNGVTSAEARNFLTSINGHSSGAALVAGVFALAASIFYAMALMALSLAVLLAQIQLILALSTLPFALLLMAIPHPKTKQIGKSVGKLLVTGFMAKTFAALILSLIFLMIIMLSNLVTGMESAGGFASIWNAIVPIIALFAIRKLPGVKEMTTFRGVMQSAGNRLSSATTAGASEMGGGGQGRPGFLRRSAQQYGRSFGQGLTGLSPYRGRAAGQRMRARVMGGGGRRGVLHPFGGGRDARQNRRSTRRSQREQRRRHQTQGEINRYRERGERRRLGADVDEIRGGRKRRRRGRNREEEGGPDGPDGTDAPDGPDGPDGGGGRRWRPFDRKRRRDKRNAEGGGGPTGPSGGPTGPSGGPTGPDGGGGGPTGPSGGPTGPDGGGGGPTGPSGGDESKNPRVQVRVSLKNIIKAAAGYGSINNPRNPGETGPTAPDATVNPTLANGMSGADEAAQRLNNNRQAEALAGAEDVTLDPDAPTTTKTRAWKNAVLRTLLRQSTEDEDAHLLGAGTEVERNGQERLARTAGSSAQHGRGTQFGTAPAVGGSQNEAPDLIAGGVTTRTVYVDGDSDYGGGGGVGAAPAAAKSPEKGETLMQQATRMGEQDQKKKARKSASGGGQPPPAPPMPSVPKGP